MELPKYKPVEKKTFKHCKYLDCNKPYWGRPIQKYCEYHTNPKHRKRIRPKSEGPAVKNQVFMHHFRDRTDVQFHCALEGCDGDFKVSVYPKLFVYPKYCERHRSEYRRNFFEKEMRLRQAG